jgi:serine/threonine protein kinase
MRDEQNNVTSFPAEKFGPYLVYEKLGAGGMATVYRAKKRGIAGFEKGVALKRMLPHLAEDAEFINSFVREAKLASLLVHPNIAQIYDFGCIDNVYYIAMEHVDGVDVRKMLRYSHRHKETIPLNVVLSILCELCEALEYAHTFVDEHGQRQEIVHRDISPSNLIVAQTGHLKVIDFGIAKTNARPVHTEKGLVKGKFSYMSPEAVVGGSVGPSADVFSAGVVAHELLTALPLFSAKSDYETMHNVREAEIPPPSRRNPGVPASLDRVVLAALERDAGCRLQTASGFRKALEQVASEAGIQRSSTDVAEWCTRSATITEHGRARDSSPPTISRNVVRGFSRAVSPGSLSPLDPPTPSIDARCDDPLVGSIAGRTLVPGTVDRITGVLPLPVIAPRMPSPPALAPSRSRSRVRAVIAVGALCTGLAVYQLAIRSTSAVAPALLTQQLPPRPAPVRFIVQPPDSIVEIGGEEVSRRSPFEIPMQRGVYSVAVSHPGYKRWTSQITLHDQESQTVNVALDPAAAIVRVSSQPAGLVAQLDGKPLEHPTPIEFETSPGPHRLVVIGPTGTWPQDFLAATDGTYTFHAVLPLGKRAPTAVTTSGSARNTPAAERTPQRASGNAARTAAAREPVVEPDDRVIELGPESPAAKPLPKVEPMPKPAAQSEPTAPLPVQRPSTPPLVPASTVTKISGELPAIPSGSSDRALDVYSKICIGIDGHVKSVKIIKPSAGIATDLQRTLLSWRYKPYVDDAGQPSPACFALNFRLVFEHAH